MLFSSVIKSAAVAASLVGSVVAAPAAVAHDHHQHKRGVVVVTQTEVVYVTAGAPQVVGGESTTVVWSAINADATASSVVASTTVVLQDQVAGASTYSASSVTYTVATSSAETASTTSAATVPTSSDSTSFSGKGITYSPYTASGACKSLSEVQSDVAQLSEYGIIRLYGVDCDQVENVLQAKADGQQLFLGIYFVDQITAGISQMASAIESYGSWDDVYTVSIGNELVNSGAATVSQVASYVSAGRSALTAAGYSGPVVSVDTHIATINNPGLCAISDYVAINAHAYFDYNTEASGAGDWLLLQIQRVWSACGGDKTVLVTETGWPHQGDTYGKAIASPEAHSTAISSIKATCGSSAILFNAFDDLWKADGAQNCEKYWGIL